MYRLINHDETKLQEPEKSVFDEFTPKLKDSTYGSKEYKSFLKGMKRALDHHYKYNRHHPEHFVSYCCNGCFKHFYKNPTSCPNCGYTQFE